MKDAHKLKASEDKETGIITMFRGQHPAVCPFRAPLLVPVQAPAIALKPGVSQLQMLPSQCNSLCPLFTIENAIMNNEKFETVTLECAQSNVSGQIIKII